MDLLGVMVSRSKVWRELKLRRLLVDLAEYSATNGERRYVIPFTLLAIPLVDT